jgi:trehalose utilization protein
MAHPIRVTVWNEFRHEKQHEEIKAVYPDGIHEAIAGIFRNDEQFEVRTATLDEPEHGLTDSVLESTDVLFWWGHMAHHEVSDEVVHKVVGRVHSGMGLVVLHSGHFSKVFKHLMGTTCDLKWRESDDNERLWVVNPSHPIAAGLGETIELEREEMYGEHFDIPDPDELVFVSWFKGGEVFRSGCTFHRGRGKIFYFRPGHESFPTYFQPDIRRVLRNGAVWAKPSEAAAPVYGNAKARQ